jgi:hypothetical protein
MSFSGKPGCHTEVEAPNSLIAIVGGIEADKNSCKLPNRMNAE